MNAWFLLIFIAVVIATGLRFRRRITLSCSHRIRELYPHELADVESALDTDELEDLMWEKTGSFGGLWRRWRNRSALVALCQLRGKHNPAVVPELKYVTERSWRMNDATLRAMLLAPLRGLFPVHARVQLIHTLEAYRELAIRTHTLLADDSPECAKRLLDVL